MKVDEIKVSLESHGQYWKVQVLLPQIWHMDIKKRKKRKEKRKSHEKRFMIMISGGPNQQKWWRKNRKRWKISKQKMRHGLPIHAPFIHFMGGASQQLNEISKGYHQITEEFVHGNMDSWGAIGHGLLTKFLWHVHSCPSSSSSGQG